jgi:transposase-like protein
MPKGYPSLNETQKSEIINLVTDKGERVPDLAREYGVIPGYSISYPNNLRQTVFLLY